MDRSIGLGIRGWGDPAGPQLTSNWDIILARESCRRGGLYIAVEQYQWDTSGPGSRSALQ